MEKRQAGKPVGEVEAVSEDDVMVVSGVTETMLAAGFREWYKDRSFEVDAQVICRIYKAIRRAESE